MSFKLAKKTKSFDLSLSSHFGFLQTKVEFLELDPLSRTLLDMEKEYEEEMKRQAAEERKKENQSNFGF